jgi:hypothetical protein
VIGYCRLDGCVEGSPEAGQPLNRVDETVAVLPPGAPAGLTAYLTVGLRIPRRGVEQLLATSSFVFFADA